MSERERERLPDTRQSITHKFSVAGCEGYLIVGLYDDGRPGDVFIKTSKAGSTVRGFMNALSVVISLALQSGISVETLVSKLRGIKFEPKGQTINPDIPNAESIVDYVFHWLGKQFIPNYEQEEKGVKQ
jgi:ribonucleoside-diphosphate reductase alpha chain